MSRPADLGSLKRGDHILINNNPCRIVQYEKSRPGKHGSAKARIVAIDIFDGSKRSIVSPVSAKVEVPLIDKRSSQIVSLGENSLQIMDLETYDISWMPMPKEEEIVSKLEVGREVEYIRVQERVKIIRVK
jgi:translation initiation factor 5A